MRNLQNLVDTEQFAEAYESVDNRDEIDRLIRERRIPEIRRWIRLTLGMDTVTVLRERARKAGILNYCRMSKDQILSELANANNNHPTDGTVRPSSTCPDQSGTNEVAICSSRLLEDQG
jgi:hypothetical protein